ncbi:unnamed protein product [Clonostachys rhizophaga]|uniref:Uncharacterized protein n=1 Tax=Clonostachys rhizophaga TaxID=160324 RepID=A0A9N9VFT2_9HYPO|nr:unnamed protein product [Clonostachys rhizophaga]
MGLSEKQNNIVAGYKPLRASELHCFPDERVLRRPSSALIPYLDDILYTSVSTDVVAPWSPVLCPMWSCQVHGVPDSSSNSTYRVNCGSL